MFFNNPFKSGYSIACQGIEIAAKHLKIDSVSNYFVRRRSVFHDNLWLHQNLEYRKRFLDLFETAKSTAPDFFNRTQLDIVQDSIYKDIYYKDLGILGRIFGICFWNKLWNERTSEIHGQ